MDDSKIYLQGKEVVTPYYLNKVKEELSKKLEVSQNFVNEFRFLIMDDPESISKEYFDTVLLPEAKVVGWEKVIVIFSHTIAYNAMGFFMFNKKVENTDASGNVTQTITFETIHPNIWEQKKSYYTSGAMLLQPTTTQIVLTIINDEFAGAEFAYRDLGSGIKYTMLPINEDARTAPKAFIPTYDAEPASKKYVDDSSVVIHLDGSTQDALTTDLTNKLLPIIKDDVKKYLFFIHGAFNKDEGTQSSWGPQGLYEIQTVSATEVSLITVDSILYKQKFDGQGLSNLCEYNSILRIELLGGVINRLVQSSTYKQKTTFLETHANYGTPFVPTTPGDPVNKKYVDDKTDSLYFEGNSNDWNALTANEQDSFLIALVEPIAETDEPVEATLQGIFQDETPTETEDDMTEDEANIQLDRIIEGGK